MAWFAAQKVAAEYREFLCSFRIFRNVFPFLNVGCCCCVGSIPALKETFHPGEEDLSVSVTVRLWAAGIVDPVQNDEGHAAGHDQEPE